MCRIGSRATEAIPIITLVGAIFLGVGIQSPVLFLLYFDNICCFGKYRPIGNFLKNSFYTIFKCEMILVNMAHTLLGYGDNYIKRV